MYHVKEHTKLCQKQLTKVTLHFVWGQLSRTNSVMGTIRTMVFCFSPLLILLNFGLPKSSVTAAIPPLASIQQARVLKMAGLKVIRKVGEKFFE